jgi:hypothetical protein
MNKEPIEIAELVGHYKSIYIIKCEECLFEYRVDNCDEFDALEHFHEQGWRIFKDRCICRKCNKTTEFD